MMFLLAACLSSFDTLPLDSGQAPVQDSAIVDTAEPVPETCDGIDNDGDGLVDEDFDEDGDGVTVCDGDCDDQDPFVAPGVPDVCDGIDNDCSGAVDEDFDEDGDGDSACGLDCDDGDPAVSGHLPEVCDGIDNNCDDLIDEGYDEDDDGYTTCRGDCDDTNPQTYPDAPEVCDGQVNGCGDETLDESVDNDGDGYSICDGDCDDTSDAAYEGAEEVCDGIDNDCNGVEDEDWDCYGCTVVGDYLWCADGRRWTEARDACETFGYTLVIIDSPEENQAVATATGGSTAWIGLSDLEEEGTFVWVDGSEAVYTSWNSGEPNDYNGEDCTQINYSVTGGWNDYPCSYDQPFVCEM